MRFALFLIATISSTVASAQSPIRVRVINAADSSALGDAVVRSAGVSIRTGQDGEATVALGDHRTIVASRIGFAPDSVTVASTWPAGVPVVIALQPTVEIEGVIVSATRSGRRIEDDPLRVEVLDREEIEEKLRMTPGDITMMLNETPGLRVQMTSPSLGGANVRVQGLRGRYTQILSDGLPLFGGQTGGLGLLQIPPMDLGGVEVIKGVASALYGGNALGGVINLISRVPQAEPVAELLVNQTMLSGSDLVGFGTQQFDEAWGGSALLGFHRQARRDIDDDGWTDTPSYDRVVVRPRGYWSSPAGHSAMFTLGTTFETRAGGTLAGFTAPDGSAYPEKLRSARIDGGIVTDWLLGETKLSLRGSQSRQGHRHEFGPQVEDDSHTSSFAEAAVTRAIDKASVVLGVAIQDDRYENEQLPAFDFNFVTTGLFAQATFDPHPRFAVTTSARVDSHNEYGTFFSPRLSGLIRAPGGVNVRLSAGQGFFAPTPLTEETEVTGLSPLDPTLNLVAERARTFSADIGRAFGDLDANATFFHSSIDNAVSVEDAGGGLLRLVNLPRPTETSGVELASRWAPEPMHFTLSYTFIDARESDPDGDIRRLVPLTPRHQAGFVASWESEAARVGTEVYYTGRQSLVDNPYRTESKPYTHLGVLVERRFGPARVFINAENLLGVRQTQFDRLVRPTRGPGGRWTTDVWGPLEGRTANVGVRF